ncbi:MULTISPECIES: DUF2752 domain-containing protein [unclassified Streptomyces]|uniref:DUF2752 domain-containing protein n=1 Tax=unclassified Streptomyces TaxID=2593676 RepID=UPI002E307660|nr:MULTISPECIES: DUF2752 domain-containing protein [unclassified Streptomyces]WUC64375.1 DUF2752 domain-containing protein [Streptomyces sp. NBC_00539]
MTSPHVRATGPAPRAPTAKTLRDAWLGAAIFTAVAVIVGLVDPTRPGRFPSCPFRSLTGFDCPGCGSLRALHELIHAHVAAAADYNLLLVAFLPYAAVVWLRAVTGRTGRRGIPRWWGPRLALIVVVLWTVLRNLPVFGGVLAA